MDGARELIAGALPYERALARYFSELSEIVDPPSIWSIDQVHRAYVGEPRIRDTGLSRARWPRGGTSPRRR